MYESPIEIIYTGMEQQLENDVLKVVQHYGINADKDELIKALRYDRDQYKKGYNDAVANLQEKGAWIPVSERLPKDRNWYLGTFKEPDTGWIIPLPFVCDYVGKETKATTKEFWILCGITDIDNPCDYYKNLECVAWQSLPEPYKEEE